MQSKNILIIALSVMGAYFILPQVGYELQSPIAKLSNTGSPTNEFSRFRTLQTSYTNLYDKQEHIIKKETARFHILHGKKINDGKVVEKINADEPVNDMTYK
jgi:hypothetical protein